MVNQLSATLSLVLVCFLVPCLAQWRRKLATELFFYNAIEGAVEKGWSDKDSIFTRQEYNIDVATAEAVARVTLLANGAEWKLSAEESKNMHQAKEGDTIRCRLRLQCSDGSHDCSDSVPKPFARAELAVFNDFNEKIVTKEFELVSAWRLETLTLPAGTKNIQSIMVRSHDFVPVTFYAAYCYVQIN